jgi:uncharacterized membrane protein YgcG
MDAVGTFVRAAEQLAAEDAFCHGDRASVVALERARAIVDYALANALVSFAEGGEWAAEGAQSAAAWIATTCQLPLAEVRRQLRRGKALPSMPLVAAAFSAGDIAGAHVDVLVKAAEAVSHADPFAFGLCEAALVEAATELKFGSFANTVTYFTQMADPDGAEEADMARRARRDAYVTQSMNGMYLLGANLDPISGAIVATEFTRIDQVLFEEDWAQAKERLGRDPKVGDLARTPAQRRADAFVEMALRSRGAKATDRRPEPSFSVLVGYESLYGPISRIEGGPIMTPGALVPWLDGASFERIIFSPGTRIECSPKARFFTGATRRAIEVRDQECTHPFCDVPAERCQIDHILPYAKGGETTQENAQAHCGFHNRQRNHGPPGGGGGDRGGGGDEGESGGGDRGESGGGGGDEGGP